MAFPRGDADGGAGYERSISQAAALVVDYLKASPDDAQLSRGRHDEGPNLYTAVVAVFPEIERMRLTSHMWDQVVAAALEALP